VPLPVAAHEIEASLMIRLTAAGAASHRMLQPRQL